ncbi:MAG: flagellar protein FlaG [Bacillota bacterium]|nr:flagellar protein FlaG [Bacillota bacterium]
MKINNLNAGNIPANTQGTDAPNSKNTDSGKVTRKPVDRTSNGDSHVKNQNKEPIKEVMTDEMLKKSIEQANKSLEMYNRKIERSVHEVTHTVMYTVRDTVTNEVIQEFPPRKIQDMIAKMWELAGLFVDEKA